MQISITNGTLTQISETLSASSGYTLPTTISVSGATSNYNSSTGAITLTNLTSSMSIAAIGILMVYPSFSDVSLTEHDDYITLTINGVDFNLSALKFTNQVISYTNGTSESVNGTLSVRNNAIYLEVE